MAVGKHGRKHSCAQPPLPYPLTARELIVLQLLAEGLSNVEIGQRFFADPTTVTYHLAELIQKAHARLRALLWSARAGLVDPSA